MDFLLVLVEILMVNKGCDMDERSAVKVALLSFAVRNPQAVKRALQKVTHAVLVILYVLTQ